MFLPFPINFEKSSFFFFFFFFFLKKKHKKKKRKNFIKSFFGFFFFFFFTIKALRKKQEEDDIKVLWPSLKSCKGTPTFLNPNKIDARSIILAAAEKFNVVNIGYICLWTDSHHAKLT